MTSMIQERKGRKGKEKPSIFLSFGEETGWKRKGDGFYRRYRGNFVHKISCASHMIIYQMVGGKG